MYNASFYPTPAPVAQRMLAMLPPLDWRTLRVLEPSAGRTACPRGPTTSPAWCLPPSADLPAATNHPEENNFFQ